MGKVGKMSDQKGADEIYCRSCGESIKQKAEICPHCGVRNEESTGNEPSNSNRVTRQHDPSQYTTTVSENWYYGVGTSLGLWTIAFALSSTTGVLSTVAGFAMLAAWALMPVAIYFDKQYLRANSQWNPSTLPWIAAALIPLVNIVASAVFLYRRHEVLGVP